MQPVWKSNEERLQRSEAQRYVQDHPSQQSKRPQVRPQSRQRQDTTRQDTHTLQTETQVEEKHLLVVHTCRGSSALSAVP